jgi:hypothetical protein
MPNVGYENTINKISDELKAGKKLYIFHAFKSDGKNHYSVENLLKIIEERSTKKGRVYHGDSSDKTKKTLYNVNEEWDKFDFIITTTSITVGVNYEGNNFDKVYLMCAGSVNNVRDVIQSSMRIRKTKENIIELFLFDKLNNSSNSFSLKSIM